MAKRALIHRVTGQGGSYLAELLPGKGYEVHGMLRRSSEEKFERIAHLRDRIALHQGDLLDQFSLASLPAQIQPDEVCTHVGTQDSGACLRAAAPSREVPP